MPNITRSMYWHALSTTRKWLLILGLTLMSPVVVVLLLFAGANEAFRFITRTKV